MSADYKDIKQLLKATEIGKQIDLYYEYGTKKYGEKKYHAAIEKFKNAKKQIEKFKFVTAKLPVENKIRVYTKTVNEKLYASYFKIGENFCENKEFSEAQKNFEEALQYSSNCDECRQKCLETIIKCKNEYFEELYYKANEFLNQEKWSEGLAALVSIQNIYPNRNRDDINKKIEFAKGKTKIVELVEQGYQELSNGKFDEAIDKFKIVIDSSVISSHNILKSFTF